jgi:predicted DCC family thiol-disulfide oxidoreductase YuxK
LIVLREDRLLTGSDASLAIYEGLGWPWRAAAILRLVPRPLRDAAYRLVARNRYRLFGQREQCWLPADGERDRIV